MFAFIASAAALAAVVAATPAWAGKQRNAEAAREHTQRANVTYNLGHFDEAARSSRPSTSWCSIPRRCSTSRRLTGRAGTPTARSPRRRRTCERDASVRRSEQAEMAGRAETCASRRHLCPRASCAEAASAPPAGRFRSVRADAHRCRSPLTGGIAVPAPLPLPAPPPRSRLQRPPSRPATSSRRRRVIRGT